MTEEDGRQGAGDGKTSIASGESRLKRRDRRTLTLPSPPRGEGSERVEMGVRKQSLGIDEITFDFHGAMEHSKDIDVPIFLD